MQHKHDQSDDWPKFLYRYRSACSDFALSEIEAAVLQRKIYFSNAEALNDPFDFRPLYRESKLRDIVKDQRKTHGLKPIISRSRAGELAGRVVPRKEFRGYGSMNKPGIHSAKLELAVTAKIFNDLPKNSYLACLSETYNNIPMWAHYANNHNGFCIEYALVLSEKNDQDPVPLKVRYAAERPILDTFHVRELTGRTKRNAGTHSKSLDAFEAMFFTKGDQWSYEREWRLLLGGKVGGYKKISCLIANRVIFGARTAEDFRQEVKKRLGGKVKLTIAKPSPQDYSYRLSTYV